MVRHAEPAVRHSHILLSSSLAGGWLTAAAARAGVDPFDHRAKAAGLPPIDSISLAPVLLGRAIAAAPTRTSIALGTEPTDGFPLGMTVGGWIQTEPDGSMYKLMVGPHHAACWVGPHFPNRTTNFEVQDFVVNCTVGAKKACLFHLTEDEEERDDLGAQPEQADRVATMLRSLEAARAGAFNPMRGGLDPKACEAAVKRFGGYWGPFEK